MTFPFHDKLTRAALTIVASLIVSGIVGVWGLSTQVSRIEERVKGVDERLSLWMKTNSDRVDYVTTRIDEITKEHRDNTRRLGVLEGRSRNN